MVDPAREPDGVIEFRLLGELEAIIDGNAIDLGHARQRCVLAALLVDDNHVVPVDELLDRVWADRLPQRARGALSSYLSRLRQLLAPAAGVALERRPGGYMLAVDPNAIDINRFRQLVAQARVVGGTSALELLDQALRLWRSEPMATLDTPWCDSARQNLEGERLAAELDRNDLALAAGRHASLVGELIERAAIHPLDERLAGQLLLAQYRCGRQADALQGYERLRHRLADELGTDPSPVLQLLHKQILTVDTALDWAEQVPSTPVPRQLPAPQRTFTGRAIELDRLNETLAAGRETPEAVVISAVSGMAGVGKTTLAVYWAHQVADRFPDGQLFVNLRGFDPGREPMTAAEAIRGFLDALGVPPQRVPSRMDDQAALYRSLLAGKRMLIVLDNARDAEHVRQLLPGAHGCLVVVTSRNRLAGLVAGEGAMPLTLDLLDSEDASNLLSRHIGNDRIAAEPDAVSQILTRCAGLPLALSTVAARAATHPAFRLAEVARELQDTHSTLDTLADADPATDIRAVFSWSQKALSAAAARLFRLLGLHPAPDVGTAAAASLAGLSQPQTRQLLAELARAHLISEHMPGRYTMHDLVRAYANEQAHSRELEPERDAATLRVLDHYLHSAHAATSLLHAVWRRQKPTSDLLSLKPAAEGATPEQFADIDQAGNWFDSEHQILLGVIDIAATSGFDTHVWQLSWTLSEFLDRNGHWHDLAATQHIGLSAARRLDDRAKLAQSHLGCGRAYVMLVQYRDASSHLHQALELLDDGTSRGRVHLYLGYVHQRQEQLNEALDQVRQSLECFRAAGNRFGEAKALNGLSWSYVMLGDYELAQRFCEQSLQLFQELGDRHGPSGAWDTLGLIHSRLGQYEQAFPHFEHALELFRELGDRYLEAEALDHIGDARLGTGDRPAAYEAWRDALAILEELGHQDAGRLRTKIQQKVLPR